MFGGFRMTLEERVKRLEAVFETKGKMKTEAEVLIEIKKLKKEHKDLTEQANNEKGAKQKELRIKAYKIQDRLSVLEWLFDE